VNNMDKNSTTLLVRCVGCGIITDKTTAEKKNSGWYKVCKDKEIYCCPNCDVTIVEK